MLLILCLLVSTGHAIPSWGKAVVNLHNQQRAPAKLANLVWSDSLATMSESATKACLTTHDIATLRRTGVGENLAWGATPQVSVGLWASEKSSYTLSTNKCAAGKMCGHYTQIVWKGTKQVGCSYNTGCSFVGKGMVSCRYWPAGNLNGQRPYGPAPAGIVSATLGTYRGGAPTRSMTIASNSGLVVATTPFEVAAITSLVFFVGATITLLVACIMLARATHSRKGDYTLMHQGEGPLLPHGQIAVIIALAILTILGTVAAGTYFSLAYRGASSATAFGETRATENVDEPAFISHYSPAKKGKVCQEANCAESESREPNADFSSCRCVPKIRRAITCADVICPAGERAINSKTKRCLVAPCCDCVKATRSLLNDIPTIPDDVGDDDI